MSTINPLVLTILEAGGSVWVASYSHIGIKEKCSSSTKPTEVSLAVDYTTFIQNKESRHLKITKSGKERRLSNNIDVMNSLFLTKELAVDHYNRCINNEIRKFQDFADEIKQKLLRYSI